MNGAHASPRSTSRRPAARASATVILRAPPLSYRYVPPGASAGMAARAGIGRGAGLGGAPALGGGDAGLLGRRQLAVASAHPMTSATAARRRAVCGFVTP